MAEIIKKISTDVRKKELFSSMGAIEDFDDGNFDAIDGIVTMENMWIPSGLCL